MIIEYNPLVPDDVHPDLEGMGPTLGPDDIRQVREIFQTPLTGSYSWDYRTADRRLAKLYALGKERNWNAELDLDWSARFPRDESPLGGGASISLLAGWEPYDALDPVQRRELWWHEHAWTLSQFLHGEQGALLVASQLVSCAPTYEAKLYAASQTFDEARHVEVFGRYLTEHVGFMYPIDPHLRTLLDKILTDPRWDLKFIGMQLIIESLALAAFGTLATLSRDPLLGQILKLVTHDESRHVAFGVTYMEQFVKALPPEEIEARATFAYEACVVMRERLVPAEVFGHFGWDLEEGRRRLLASSFIGEFRRLLFSRIVPNLKRVGLLTERVRPLYDELGVLEYENLVDDGQIDWAVVGAELPVGEQGQAARVVS